ncbi:MAG: TlyA family RNA methyltransferase, partial [Methylocystis sp.]|nr:TlyA family RNA methyltransferase [Methylocystis sp.]
MGATRADTALHARGLFESRAKAREAIDAGLVSVDGRIVKKPSEPIASDANIVARAPYPWVSRGGVKLAHGLDHFGVDPKARFCLDIGASTGGFTDVLLTRGARHVVAVDVGHGQLHERLRGDLRVTSLEGQDARTLTAANLAEPPSLIVIDASFISLSVLLPPVLSLAAPNAELVALI